MGIALEYAFVVAVAGGLAAICLAYVLESIEDEQIEDRSEPRYGSPVPERMPLRSTAFVKQHPRQMTRLPLRVDYSPRHAASRSSLTPK